ncbi:MAG: hypothetical protein IJT54_02470 [Candidatus Methanomethylophilaceae archaeon]|nr:hypothetical protein [Candidatus Methanomethylophilaceae archaeon]
MKLNRDLKKAIHSGSGYDDYMTIYQFQMQKLAIIRKTLRDMKHSINDFYEEGGETYETDENEFCASIDGVTLHVAYDDEGNVIEYSIKGMRKKPDVAKRILNLFFYEHIIPIFEDIIETTQEQLKNLDNDNTLRGLYELRDIMRGDKYLTAAAISGLEIVSEDDRDIFADIFGGEE